MANAPGHPASGRRQPRRLPSSVGRPPAGSGDADRADEGRRRRCDGVAPETHRDRLVCLWPEARDPQGSAVLGGHLDSREYGIGPLAVLRRLRDGDVIVVRTTTGRETFRVTSIRMIRKQALPLRTLFDRDGQRRLRIVTCGGPYIRSRGGYQDNLVVTAIPDGRTPPDRRVPRVGAR